MPLNKKLVCYPRKRQYLPSCRLSRIYRLWAGHDIDNAFLNTYRSELSFSAARMRICQKLQPFRLLHQDLAHLRQRYLSDWTVFNQLIVASAVYVFFTNLLPGITFASDLYVLTGKQWGTIEVVFSTGLCGVIFAL